MPHNAVAASDPALRTWFAPPIDEAEAQPLSGPSTSRAMPSRITNAPTDSDLALRERARAVKDALERTGAAQVPGLLHMLTTAEPDRRELVVTRLEEAIAGRNRGTELTAFKDLLLNMANATLGRLSWSTLSHAWPALGGVAAAGQLGQAVYNRSWQGVAAALPSLALLLPAARNIEGINTLLDSLPDAVTSTLSDLNQWVQQTDDELGLHLDIRHVPAAAAVAMLLWYVQQRLPLPSRQLQGMEHLIANLPQYWQRLVSTQRIADGLFGPNAGRIASYADPEIERSIRKKMTPEERMVRKHYQIWVNTPPHLAGNATEPPLPEELTVAVPDPVALPFDAWQMPATVQLGGPIALPPEGGREATTSAGHRETVNWLSWLATTLASLSAGAGFQQVAQSEDIEMGLMGTSAPATETTAVTPLIQAQEAAVTATATGVVQRAVGTIRRNPLYCATTAVLGGVTAIGGLTYGAMSWLLGGRAASGAIAELTPTQLADVLANEVVAFYGAWGTGLDLLLGTPDLPGPRRKRAALDELYPTTAAPDNDLEQLGITAAQRDQLLADAGLRTDLRSLQAWSLAVAQEVAAQDGWQWVAQLPSSEQELLVSQLHILQGLDATLSNLEAVPPTLLNEALHTAGWRGSADRLEVDLGPTTVAGVTVQQRMPLLEYCLLRADGKQPDKISFLHDGVVVEGAQHRTLSAFIAGTGCTQLQTRVTEQGESLREPLKTAVRARLVIDALKAKKKGDLGSGRNDYLRGADIVLAYLQGGTDVESAALTYTDTLADGSAVSIRVPNYLLLRSTSADPAVNGQVVLYRADLARFEIFDNEKAFRQFLDKQRAGSGLPFVDRKLDRTLMDDIVAAAPPALQAQVRERVSHWEERQAMFQSGKGGQQAWNAQDAFVLDFKPVTQPGHALGDWAGVLVAHGQQREQQRLAANGLRWSPLGIANADSEARHQQGLKDDLQTVQAYSHPAVTRALTDRLSGLGFGDTFAGLDPAKVELQLPGGPTMNLVDWAVSGWQQHGLKRIELPVNLPDLPDGPGLPMQSLPDEAWPSDDDLFGMRFTVYTGNGTRVIDERLTEQLQDADVQRAICSELDDFAQSNRLADAYLAHLRGIADNKAHSFHATLADRIVTHSLWMIETAHQQGQLDATAYAALKAAHARLEPGQDGVSSLQTVKLGPHGIPGVWSLEAAGTHYVFLTDTRAGDQLLDEKAFRRWLVQPGDEARSYVLNHAPLRHHDSLNAMFDKKQSANGIKLGFGKSTGPQEAASDYIQMRISNVDETTVSQLERAVEGLKLFGAAVAAISCAAASGGTLAALCVSSTLALLADSIPKGLQLLERNDIDGAIMEFGGGLADALDVTGVTDLPRILFQLGRRGLNTVKEATQALGQWRAFNARFNRDGQISERVLLPSRALSASAQPMLLRALPGGGVVFEQGDQLYVKQGQHFAPVLQREGESHLRLLDPASPAQGGPPLEYRNGRWQKRQGDATFIPTTQRSLIAGPTTPPSVLQGDWVSRVPEAEKLPPDKLNELEVVFGIGKRGARITPDLRQQVREIAMQARIDQIIQTPDSLGLPGDEAITIRAWADSPLLGKGCIVETFVMEHGERYTGFRIGSGRTGLSIQVSDSRQLPDVNRLIDESDIDALHRRLGLPEDADRSLLLQKVREEIARTIKANQTQMLKTWRAVLQKFDYTPTAVDNLLKHFPQLLREEAELLIKSDPRLEKSVLNWEFQGALSAQVADFLAERNMRQQRESVLKGEFDSPSKVIELNRHLQKVLPEHSWKVQSGSSGEGNALSFHRKDDNNNVVRILDFEPDGRVHIKGPDTDETVSSWEQGIYQLLSPHGKQTVADSTALRNSVLNNMRETPVAGTCAIPRKTSGKVLVKRGLDCDVPPGISLDRNHIDLRDSAANALTGMHARLDVKFNAIRREQREFKALQNKVLELKKNKQVLDEVDAKRLAQLQKQNFRTLNGYEGMNAAYYEVNDLTYNGMPVDVSSVLPANGFALSASIRKWMEGEDTFVNPVPIRRVFLPASQAEGQMVQNGLFREDYALGADLIHAVGAFAQPGQASKKLTLTGKDLMVKSRTGGPDRLLYELSDSEIAALEVSDLSDVLGKWVGDGKLLPSNARTLRPGDYYMYQIRSCSESKIMDGLFDALAEKLPDVSMILRGKSPGTIDGLKGQLVIMSDMNPCAVSCDRRLTELMAMLPELEVKVFYHYLDPKERMEYLTNAKIQRIIERNRDEWDALDYPEEDMRRRAALELKKAEVIEWLEQDLLHTPIQPPVPRLWVPKDEEGL